MLDGHCRSACYVWGSLADPVFARMSLYSTLYRRRIDEHHDPRRLRATVCCLWRRGGFHLRCVALSLKKEVPPPSSSFDCRAVVLLHPPIFFSSFSFTAKLCSPFGGCSLWHRGFTPQGRSSQIASFTDRCTRGPSSRNKPSSGGIS